MTADWPTVKCAWPPCENRLRMRRVCVADDGSGGRPDVDAIFGRDNQWCSVEHRTLSESGADPAATEPSYNLHLTQFGFDWGPMTVERTTLLPDDRRVLGVLIGGKPVLHIYVSKTGRSVRVFRDHKELKPRNPKSEPVAP